MVYRLISKDLKDCTLWHISHGCVPEDICKLFDISPRSVDNRIYGSLILPPNPMQCCPRILNGDMTHDLYTLLEEAPEMYLNEIQDWIALTYEVHIFRTALHKNIHDAGYLSNFFAGQQLSAMKTSSRSGNKTSIHTLLPCR